MNPVLIQIRTKRLQNVLNRDNGGVTNSEVQKQKERGYHRAPRR